MPYNTVDAKALFSLRAAVSAERPSKGQWLGTHDAIKLPRRGSIIIENMLLHEIKLHRSGILHLFGQNVAPMELLGMVETYVLL